MLRTFLILALGFCMLFGGIKKENIAPQMQQNIDEVIKILQDETLDKATISEEIFQRFDGDFDFKLMARLSLGPSQWNRLSSDDQERFTKHFIARLKRSFIQKLELYSDEIMVTKETKEVQVGKATRIYLITELVGKEKNYPITYKFYETKDNDWMIYDLDILDVSLIQTYRSQFDGYLDSHSLDELITWLDEDEDL